jgi:hypothetical protein
VDVLNLPFKHYLWVGKVLLESDFAGIHFWKPLGEADIDTEDDRNPYRLTFSVSLPHLPNLFVVPLKIQFPYPLTPAAVNFVTEESTKFLNRARVTLGEFGLSRPRRRCENLALAARRTDLLWHIRKIPPKRRKLAVNQDFTRGRDTPYFVLAY